MLTASLYINSDDIKLPSFLKNLIQIIPHILKPFMILTVRKKKNFEA